MGEKKPKKKTKAKSKTRVGFSIGSLRNMRGDKKVVPA
jgi:hypothetical protein